ncbi:hypothetical protein GW17_00041270 [Ensete ventricosum]|nr:hypothetical protein GW17_00041270 [Ensete ventricosum]
MQLHRNHSSRNRKTSVWVGFVDEAFVEGFVDEAFMEGFTRALSNPSLCRLDEFFIASFLFVRYINVQSFTMFVESFAIFAKGFFTTMFGYGSVLVETDEGTIEVPWRGEDKDTGGEEPEEKEKRETAEQK